MRRAGGARHAVAVVVGDAAGGVGGRAAIAGEDGQVARVGGDPRILRPGGGGHPAIGGERGGPEQDRLAGVSLRQGRRDERAAGWRGRADALGAQPHEGPAGLDDPPKAREDGRAHRPVGGEALDGLPLRQGGGETGCVGRAACPQLARDQRRIGFPTGLDAPERCPGLGPERGGVGARGRRGTGVAGGSRRRRGRGRRGGDRRRDEVRRGGDGQGLRRGRRGATRHPQHDQPQDDDRRQQSAQEP